MGMMLTPLTQRRIMMMPKEMAIRYLNCYVRRIHQLLEKKKILPLTEEENNSFSRLIFHSHLLRMRIASLNREPEPDFIESDNLKPQKS